MKLKKPKSEMGHSLRRGPIRTNVIQNGDLESYPYDKYAHTLINIYILSINLGYTIFYLIK